MKDFMRVSPLRVLDKSSSKELGQGRLGVLIARAGVGKTACLIHIAFDRIFRGGKLIHISVGEGPEKVSCYYNVIFYDLVKALEIKEEDEFRLLMERNRMILAYLKKSFSISRLRANLESLRKNLKYHPDTLIVDGLDFENTERGIFEGLKDIANEFQTEIWLSALSHRHKAEVNEKGIPFPCDKLDDLFSVIIQLMPDANGVCLKLLKDHDKIVKDDMGVRLDPNTFLVK